MAESNPERWQQVREIFDAALKLPPGQRAGYLENACGAQPDLRREVESLLASYDDADAFLEKPAVPSLSSIFGLGKSWAGKIVGSYRVVEEIGQGGMGVIYRAEDVRLGRSAALKFLPDDMTREPGALSRFKREAQTASALNHPHICTIYGVDDYEGHPYIAMEFLQGRTLEQITTEGPLHTEKLLELAIQIADALDAAHSERIIHRDIKPSNIFVTQRGQAKVVDFGIAKKAPAPRTRKVDLSKATHTISPELLTTPGAAMGTVAYMSPEQARGEELDVRTDLFSFGAVLYEMAAGQPAFPGKTTAIIHDAILNRAPVSPLQLNPKLPARLEEMILKALEKDRALRYPTAAALRDDLRRLKRDIDSGRIVLRDFPQPSPWLRAWQTGSSFLRRRWQWAATVALVLAIGTTLLVRSKWTHPRLTDRDSILIADFDNTTGDPVFDGALKRALLVKLDESPFLNVIPEDRIQQTLRYMGRQPDERITPELAREICQRQEASALLIGAIARLGNHYVIELNASACQTGSNLGIEQAEAESKEQVLRVVGAAASRLRAKLGESVNSIQKYDTPIEEATTGSLDALKAYSMGEAQRARGSDPGSLPFYRRAVELDPNFAMAYATLGAVYANMGESKLAAENAKRAFDLRDRVSERERFYIAAHYYGDAGQLDKSVEEYLIWQQSYPRDWIPHNNLCSIYAAMGWLDKALPEGQKALELEPNDPLPYTSLASVYMALNRYDEAQAVLDDAKQMGDRRHVEGLDDALFHGLSFTLASVRGDAEAKESHANWAAGKPDQMFLLSLQAQEAASAGKIKLAQRLWQESAAISARYRFTEISALMDTLQAHWLAEVGMYKEAQRLAREALSNNQGETVQSLAADVLANSGAGDAAGNLNTTLAAQFPQDLLLSTVWLASARARAQFRQAAYNDAIKTLEPALPYELGLNWQTVPFRAIYIRGLAYLRLNDGLSAAAEFKKIIDHRGVDPLSPYFALAHLGTARAATLSGQAAESRKRYQEFLTLWKEADPDLPLFQQAKAEYQKLR